ncbi:MAG TPA: ATP-dependent metallopeptidase FtsH/Yme1/Tma family protein, partial [Angustibacter sp.]|nr:ATP-dependent metallopeptidase FtsH/Yme1/Tma family protein [Angustibacter sp.]
MDAKRYFRGPIVWIVVAVLAVLVISQMVSTSGGYKKVDTAVALNAIAAKQVDSARIVDREQRIELTLKPNATVPGVDATRIRASYVDGEQVQIVDLLKQNPPPKLWDVQVPTQSWLQSLLVTLLPFVFIAIVF